MEQNSKVLDGLQPKVFLFLTLSHLVPLPGDQDGDQILCVSSPKYSQQIQLCTCVCAHFQ